MRCLQLHRRDTLVTQRQLLSRPTSDRGSYNAEPWSGARLQVVESTRRSNFYSGFEISVSFYFILSTHLRAEIGVVELSF